MAITKYEKIYGLPEELSDEFLIFDEGKCINKCKIEVNGEVRDIICVYEYKRKLLTDITYGESINMMNSNGTVFSIHGWRVNVSGNNKYSIEELFDPETASDYIFKVRRFTRTPSFVESAMMIKEMGLKGCFNSEQHSTRK